MWITWLVMLRQTPETSIGTSIVRKRHPRYSSPEKEEWKGCCSVGSRKGQFTDVFSKNEHTQVPLDEYKLLSDRQHAFRKGHSCETQLTTVINDWAKILHNRGQVDTFILDFENAFDTAPHELLKSKLFSYGIGGKTLKWIDSFLCFRQQRVVVNGV